MCSVTRPELEEYTLIDRADESVPLAGELDEDRFDACFDHRVVRGDDLRLPVFVVRSDAVEDCAAPKRFGPDRWLDLGTAVQIPMAGEADSLNASVAAAIVLYEAVRQRQK